MKNVVSIIFGLIFLTLLVGGGFMLYQQEAPVRAEKTAFAQCTADAGAIFYGAFWCPFCSKQKALFGSAEKHINYVECSTPDRSAQTQICIDEGIKSYPTWKFEGRDLVCPGLISLDMLSEITSCSYEGDEVATAEELYYEALIEPTLASVPNTENKEEVEKLLREQINEQVKNELGIDLTNPTREDVLKVIVSTRCITGEEYKTYGQSGGDSSSAQDS